MILLRKEGKRERTSHKKIGMFLLQVSPRSGRSCSGKKFVAFDARRNASAAVMWLDADDLREAPDMHIPGHGNLSRQGKNKFDGTSHHKIGVDQKI